jgi:hypothetical protein
MYFIRDETCVGSSVITKQANVKKITRFSNLPFIHTQRGVIVLFSHSNTVCIHTIVIVRLVTQIPMFEGVSDCVRHITAFCHHGFAIFLSA